MSGSISFVPTALPPGLYQQAAGLQSSTMSVQFQTASTSSSFSPSRSNILSPSTATNQSILLPQGTGKGAPALPARPSANFQQQTNGHLASEWDVTPTEKASSDRYFETLDSYKMGYIEGDAAVPFMLKSHLSGEVLAHIWCVALVYYFPSVLITTTRDLADIHHDGRLTKDGFAIAMHLIQRKLLGHEVPLTLPSSLIPPSLRASMLSQSPFSPANIQQQPEPVANLLELEDTPPPSAAPSQSLLKPQLTGPMMSTQQVLDNDPFSVPSQICKLDSYFPHCNQTHHFQRRVMTFSATTPTTFPLHLFTINQPKLETSETS